jgi:hypothetical protein
MNLSASIVCFIAVAALSTTAHAAVQNYNCNSTSCSYRFQMKKLGTREFRGQCYGTRPNYSEGGRVQCTAGQKPMTCTVTATPPNPMRYYSCSCTNWSVGKKIDAKISIKCQPRE